MSWSEKEERVCVELTAVQHQQNGREDPQSLSTASNNKTSPETQQNVGETSSRHLAAVNVSERAKTYLHNHRQHLEIVLLTVVIAVVLLLLLLPTLFYHLPPQSGNGNQSNKSSHGNGRSNETSIQPLPTARVPEQLNCSTLQCQEDFSCSVVGNTSVCLPVCGSWDEYPHETVVATDVVIVLSAVIGVVISIAMLLTSCIRWKNMFTFPSVFVVYMTITLMVLAIFVLIAYTDRTSLFCLSEHLYDAESLQWVGPTPFCNLTGTVLYYGLFQLAMWWFCHEVSLFWKIRFPFHARSFETTHRIKYVHITMVIVGLVLPALPVIVTFATAVRDSRGFGLIRFPPILCSGLQRDATFYSFVLPINIVLAIGIPLLIIIFWIIHRQHGLLRKKQSKQLVTISTAERKLLMVFCYYVLLDVLALMAFTITTRNIEQFEAAVTNYWQCELTGVDPENPCDALIASYREFSNPVLSSFAFVILGTSPAVNLIFAINFSQLKQKFKIWCRCAAMSREGPSTSSTVSASATQHKE